ncbi:MAG: sigma 54-interacting transcriptional regulator [Deltaproteobacteria bacterium]|nr:sigma 54-interacting transcriptional regulator [Deltaproteobacteria bacterium]
MPMIFGVDDPRRYLGLHTVSMLRELIRKWWQVDIGFADSSGRLLDEAWGQVPVSGNDFCRALLTADQGRKVCLKCVREINGRLRGVRASPKPVSHICHLGLGMVACPVHVRKRYSGFVFACGYSNRELSRTRIGRLRGSLADILDKKVSLAGERVPVLGREDVERMKDLLEYGAREMALFDRELARLETVPGEDTEISFKGIIDRSPAMTQAAKLLKKAASSAAPILLIGQKGTGKKVLARAIHLAGPRRQGQFIMFDGSSDPATAEARLFGQVRGGSIGKLGSLEAARGGSVYLCPGAWQAPQIQIRLLRLLQENTSVPVGGDRPLEINVRLLFGLDGDFDQEVVSGRLRKDLADWLTPNTVKIPPLKSRIEDIAELIDLFIRRHLPEGRPKVDLHPDALALLQRYSWPGNANELEDEIRSLLSLCPNGESLTDEFISLRIRQAAGHGSQALTKALKSTRELKQAVEILEKELIHEGLVRTRWNKSLLARQLGISRSNLLAKIEKYDLGKSRLTEE